MESNALVLLTRVWKHAGSKGQTALEFMFIVLFILLAVGALLQRALVYDTQITETAKARALAQGICLELSLEGTTTYLIRIDEDFTPPSTPSYKLYVFSENCALARQRITSALAVSEFKCRGRLFGDADLVT